MGDAPLKGPGGGSFPVLQKLFPRHVTRVWKTTLLGCQAPTIAAPVRSRPTAPGALHPPRQRLPMRHDPKAVRQGTPNPPVTGPSLAPNPHDSNPPEGHHDQWEILHPTGGRITYMRRQDTL